MKRKKSIAVNAGLSSVNTLLSIIFSLIIFPYVSRKLTVDNIGAINFSNSILSYFILAAGLGMGSLVVRNGSKIKDDRKKLTKFVCQMFSINVIAMAVSFTSLIVLLSFPTKIVNYRMIIIIQSISLITTPMTLTWFYSIFEDFKYITIRNFFVKLISFVLILVFVRNENDIIPYVLICSFGDAAANIINFIYSRKYLKLKFTFHTDWKIYKNSIFTFFVNSIATTIYLNSDITMLGFLCNESTVGLYSVSTKIYNILKQVINAAVIAVLPRLAYYADNNREGFESLINKILRVTFLVSMPITAGVIILNKDIIVLASGEKYMEAAPSLVILSLAIGLTMAGVILSCGVLISYKREKVVMRVSVISAVVNVIFNFILIPVYQEVGAAITTVLAELVMLVLLIYFSFPHLRRINCLDTLYHASTSSMVMILYSCMLNYFTNIDRLNTGMRVMINIITCSIVYFITLIIIHDETFMEITRNFIRKYKNHRID